jgi:hypothetical protein
VQVGILSICGGFTLLLLAIIIEIFEPHIDSRLASIMGAFAIGIGFGYLAGCHNTELESKSKVDKNEKDME